MPQSWAFGRTTTSRWATTRGSAVSSVRRAEGGVAFSAADNTADLGYLVGEYPMCILLQKFPIAKVTAANMIVWGVILAMMAVAHNFAGLMVVRL